MNADALFLANSTFSTGADLFVVVSFERAVLLVSVVIHARLNLKHELTQVPHVGQRLVVSHLDKAGCLSETKDLVSSGWLTRWTAGTPGCRRE